MVAQQNERHFEVELVRSGTGRSDSQRRTLLGLGIKRFGQRVFLKDTPAVRGMLYKVVHLVRVTPKAGQAPLSARGRVRAQQAKGN